ncbi:MAG: zinc ribbon domain-containing protein [Anaerolineae bacterium]|jgi:putative FmdB family regulatory protein|nr:zinc ribbon domain-containing protein [Anaerolineae bacterium]
MPLYEYQCTDCGLRFERRQHFSDPPISVCPECGGEVVRLVQPVGIIFRGSGFYVTDHHGRSSTVPPKTRKEEGETSTGSESKPGETKSESSTEKK